MLRPRSLIQRIRLPDAAPSPVAAIEFHVINEFLQGSRIAPGDRFGKSVVFVIKQGADGDERMAREVPQLLRDLREIGVCNRPGETKQVVLQQRGEDGGAGLPFNTDSHTLGRVSFPIHFGSYDNPSAKVDQIIEVMERHGLGADQATYVRKIIAGSPHMVVPEEAPEWVRQ